MSLVSTNRAGRGRRQALAALGYILLVFGLALAAEQLISNLMVQANDLSAKKDLLAQIESRRTPSGEGGAVGEPVAPGSPFLDGQTVTVAGAALQQRAER